TWNVKNVFFNEDEESIFAPCKVETLGRYAFENLKMKNLIMPKSLKYVEGALSGYDESEIEMIEFGPALETISYDCFYRLNRLNTIVVQAEVPPTLALDKENWWDGFDPEGIMLSVPSRSWQAYSEASGWKEFFVGRNSLDISVAGVDRPICYFVNAPVSRDASDEEQVQKIYVRDGYSMGLQSGKTLTLGFDIPEGRTLARLELNGKDMLPAVRDNKVAITLQGDSRLEMALDGAAATETLATGGAESEVMERYDLTGRPVGASASGVIIEKNADGRVCKVVK
ncbi:MAG: leucine-rich repeat domain-containing protein, partial [Muribaculaceae bacterium]|nr:leucine-rich repeat domain-containing protein [Muribaculaceae bacterium]